MWVETADGPQKQSGQRRRTFLLYSVAAWGILVVMKSFTSGYLQYASSQVLPGKCEIDSSLRVDCGQRSITPQECVNLGCCYDEQDSVCFYRLNGEIGAHPMTSAWVEVKLRCSICKAALFPAACSLDGHFVFSVKATETEVPIDPSALLVKGHPHCLPVVITPDTAVFKIRLEDCGSKMKVVWEWKKFQNWNDAFTD